MESAQQITDIGQLDTIAWHYTAKNNQEMSSVCLGCQVLHKKLLYWTSLVVQWLRICLPMQGTWVQSLVQEDPPCQGATKPAMPQLRKSTHLEPVLH